LVVVDSGTLVTGALVAGTLVAGTCVVRTSSGAAAVELFLELFALLAAFRRIFVFVESSELVNA
jgi:hypothetical protein